MVKTLLHSYNHLTAYMSTANPQYLAEISVNLCLGSFELWARGYVNKHHGSGTGALD